MARNRFTLATVVLIAAIASSLALAAAEEAPVNWDGLVQVKSRKLDAVFLSPGADFRTYTKVMFDPTEVALKKNWRRDYNNSSRDISRNISDADVQKGFDRIRTGFAEVFAKAYTDAGYQVVTAPGPDVLRVRTGVLNLSINAPDTMSAGRVKTYSREAGSATLVLEARDSVSGALLGRAVDARLAGNNTMFLRNRATNNADFSRLFRNWATESVAGLAELKALSPVDVAAGPLKK